MNRKTMNSLVKHAGTVVETKDKAVHVRISQTTACGSCQVASHCSAVESREKIIEVSFRDRQPNIGEEIIICTSSRTAQRAVLLGFGYPLLILMTVLFLTKLYGFNDATAAISAIISIIPYYILLRLFRKRISQKVIFMVEET